METARRWNPGDHLLESLRLALGRGERGRGMPKGRSASDLLPDRMRTSAFGVRARLLATSRSTGTRLLLTGFLVVLVTPSTAAARSQGPVAPCPSNGAACESVTQVDRIPMLELRMVAAHARRGKRVARRRECGVLDGTPIVAFNLSCRHAKRLWRGPLPPPWAGANLDIDGGVALLYRHGDEARVQRALGRRGVDRKELGATPLVLARVPYGE